MSQSNYIYNPETHLWHPIIAEGTGDDIHSSIDPAGGVINPPPYVASVGQPIITEDAYLCFTQSATLPVSSPVFALFGCVVSDQIESYCGKSWRILAEEIPVSVQMVAAFVIRDWVVNKSTGSSQFKSYSDGDYSWTMQDGIAAGDILAPYKPLLANSRELSIYV